MMKLLLSSLIICFSTTLGVSQKDTTKNTLIQFSGVIVSGDSLEAVPFCHIIDKSVRRGTTSDYFGYFSFVANKNT